MRKLLLACLAGLLGGCSGLVSDYTYRVRLNDGTISHLHASYPMQVGDTFKGSMNGTTWLYEQADGTICGTILEDDAK